MPTDVRDAPGGTRLLYIDGPVLRADPSGPRIAYIEAPDPDDGGVDILEGPDGRRLVYLDGDDVRRTRGGERVAYWDAVTLRRAPSLPALLVVDLRDVRAPDGTRRYHLEGSIPSLAQLTAALYRLDPTLFQPSRDEQAAVSVHFSADGPPPDFDGAWVVGGPSGAALGGSVTVSGRRPGPWLAVTHAAADGSTWRGIGTRTVGRDDRLELIVAMAPDDSAELGVLLDGDGPIPTLAWLSPSVAAGRDDATRDQSASGFEASLEPHPRGADAKRVSALMAPGGVPVWRLGGHELFAGSARGPIHLWRLVHGEAGLAGEVITGDGAFGTFELARAE